MLLKSKLYTKAEPSADARLVIIYCEGKKREYAYFKYFNQISSQIKIEVEAPEQHDDTSPMGVLNKANAQLIKTDTNQNPKYNIESVDQIWFVIDTDDWGEKITTLKANCQAQTNWFVVQSNPCFEVWLFYHFYPFAAFDDMAISQQWKTHLNSKIPGGFDSRKHPIYIKTAIANAEHKFKCESGNINAIGCTEVFKLAEIIYPLVCDKLENGLLGMKA